MVESELTGDSNKEVFNSRGENIFRGNNSEEEDSGIVLQKTEIDPQLREAVLEIAKKMDIEIQLRDMMTTNESPVSDKPYEEVKYDVPLIEVVRRGLHKDCVKFMDEVRGLRKSVEK